MQWSICYFNHEDKVLHDRAVRCGIVRSPAGEKGRKATSIAETRRDVTRKDEGRQGSRTVALNAVPSDRQHRLLCESLARFSLSSFRARLSSLCTISVFFLFCYLYIFSTSLSSSLSVWRRCNSRDNNQEKIELLRIENAGLVQRTPCFVSRVRQLRVSHAEDL